MTNICMYEFDTQMNDINYFKGIDLKAFLEKKKVTQ